ncbi:enoyl-CoA hydratase/isomerase [Bordetella pertussis]|nr:enoyl-CoA hydratase/isomerase [Bordetella pertussis]
MAAMARCPLPLLAVARGKAADVLGLDGFDALAERRLAYYAGRRAALAIARKARLAMEPPDAAVARIRALEPLMHENFRIPGVQETIQHYLAGLRTRRAG